MYFFCFVYRLFPYQCHAVGGANPSQQCMDERLCKHRAGNQTVTGATEIQQQSSQST